MFSLLQLLVCLCATLISAEAFIKQFSPHTFPIVQIPTVFSVTPLTKVMRPVDYLSFQLNSLEHQQELHNWPITAPIQAQHETFTYKHSENVAVPHPIGFKTYGLPIASDKDIKPTFQNRPQTPHQDVPVVELPIVSTPVSIPAPTTIANHQQTPTPIINLPTDTIQSSHEFALEPEYSLPALPLSTIVVSLPAELPTEQLIDDHSHNRTAIQPILTLTPPLNVALPAETPAASIDELPIRPAPGIFAPSDPLEQQLRTEAPPLIHTIANAALLRSTATRSSTTKAIESILSADNNLTNQYSSPDGTTVSESGWLWMHQTRQL